MLLNKKKKNEEEKRERGKGGVVRPGKNFPEGDEEPRGHEKTKKKQTARAELRGRSDGTSIRVALGKR